MTAVMRERYDMRWIVTLLMLLSVLCDATPVAARKRRTTAPEPRKTAYERLFAGKNPRTVQGLFTLHLLDGDVYFEVPDSMLGRDLLLGVTVLSVSECSLRVRAMSFSSEPIRFCRLPHSTAVRAATIRRSGGRWPRAGSPP